MAKKMTKKAFDENMSNIRDLEAMIKNLEAELEERKEAIKDFMEAEGLEEFATDLYRATYKTVVSSRFDSSAFKKDHPKMYENYIKATGTVRFNMYDVK